jgi:ADP-L-glycero-D-manno-heptose 6-epimerase
MRILLTGHKGFIGQNAYKEFTDLGHEVIGYEWNETFEKPNLNGIDLVVHMGAISSTAEKNVEKIFHQNYDFTTDLIDRCVMHDIPMQISSSGAVYGRGKEFKETSPVFPMSPYAWTKYMVEKYCRKYPNASIKLFRYFNVYSSEGETESHKVGQCSPHYKFRKQAENHKHIELYVHPINRTSYRDFIHVKDVVNYHVKFFESNATGIFNIGTGKAKSFEDVAKDISKEYNVEIVELPMPEDMASYIQWYTCADITKLRETLE